MHSAIIILFLLDIVAAKNCFSLNENCEIITMAGNYYACDALIEFDKPIKAIGSGGNKTLVEVEEENSVMYSVDEVNKEANIVQEVFDPIGKLTDRNNNSYYVAGGSTYVSISKTKQVLQITTSQNSSSSQLALDIEGNALFILTSTKSDENDDFVGFFFAVPLNPLDVVNSSINAEWLEQRQNITAIFAHNGKLFFGLRTGDGTGKLVTLTRVPRNGCSNNVAEVLIKLTEQYIEKIATDCEIVGASITHNRTHFFNNTLNAMMSENMVLKKEVNQLMFNCNYTERPTTMLPFASLKPAKLLTQTPASIATNVPALQININSECQPTYKIQLENTDLKAKLRLVTNKFQDIASSIWTLYEEIDKRVIPTVKPEVIVENAYRGPKKCLEVFELNALTDNIERLEKLDQNLRLRLLNYANEFQRVFSEVSPLISDANGDN